MVDFESVKDDINLLRSDVNKISERQRTYVNEHHNLEKEVVELKSDVHYILKGQDSMNANLTKFMFIIVSLFAAAFVAFIIKGGLVL